jgi:hypothetical protein
MGVGINGVHSVKLLFQNIFKIAACLAAFNAVVNFSVPLNVGGERGGAAVEALR